MSAVDTRAVPCNFLSWPTVANLLPDQKFIGMYLFCSPDANACGCYFLFRPRAADLSLPVAVLEEALREFERRKLVARDQETGEIFVLSWPRWMTFKTPAARGALWPSIDRIKSPKLSTLVKNAYESTPRPGKGGEKGRMRVGSSSFEEEQRASLGRGALKLPQGWWESEAATIAAGKVIGILPLPGEDMRTYRDRLQSGHPRRSA